MLRRRHGRDRVELEEAEPPHGLEDSLRPAVEPLRADRDAPRLLDRHLTHGAPLSSPSTRASLAAARSSFAPHVPAHPRLGMEAPHVEDALRAVRLEVGAADDPVAGEQGQHVVAVRALVLALVDLDHVAEAEEPLEQRPVPDEVVERAERGRAAPGRRRARPRRRHRRAGRRRPDAPRAGGLRRRARATWWCRRARPPLSRQCSRIAGSVSAPRARTARSASVRSVSSSSGVGASRIAFGMTRSARS